MVDQGSEKLSPEGEQLRGSIDHLLAVRDAANATFAPIELPVNTLPDYFRGFQDEFVPSLQGLVAAVRTQGKPSPALLQLTPERMAQLDLVTRPPYSHSHTYMHETQGEWGASQIRLTATALTEPEMLAQHTTEADRSVGKVMGYLHAGAYDYQRVKFCLLDSGLVVFMNDDNGIPIVLDTPEALLRKAPPTAGYEVGNSVTWLELLRSRGAIPAMQADLQRLGGKK
jgi:hypothetical protein